MSSVVVHQLWVSGPLSNLEKISSNSFVQKGYSTVVWSYGGLDNAPKGAEVRDARLVLPESMIFRGKSGSLAQFSDLFRYAVLNSHGGMWADTDVVALAQPESIGSQPFLVTERDRTKPLKAFAKKILGRSEGRSVNSNVIFNPRPTPGNIIDLAYAYAKSFPKEKIVWGELGPRLLAAIESIYPDHGFIVHDPVFANPIDWWHCPHAILAPTKGLSDGSSFLHLYNETWRRAGIDKNSNFPRGSLMAELAETYLY